MLRVHPLLQSQPTAMLVECQCIYLGIWFLSQNGSFSKEIYSPLTELNLNKLYYAY